MAQAQPSNTQSLAKTRADERKSLENALVVRNGDGSTELVIPPELRDKYNVLGPLAVLTQADPHFVPAFSVVQLDPDPNGAHFYPMTGANKGKLAMTKDAIQQIANVAGIDFSLDPGGREHGDPVDVYLFGSKVMSIRAYKYTAIGRYRKSDGTHAAARAEREWIPQREALEIEMEASGKPFLKTDPEKLQYAKKEFLRNLEFRSMMAKSKAQNAVMRAAFGIRQKYTPQQAAKPFFIISYNFSAGTDPAALAVVASLVGADISNLYGSADAPQAALPESATVIDIDDLPAQDEAPEDAGEAEVIDVDAEDDEGDMLPSSYDDMPTADGGVMPYRQAKDYVLPAGTFKGSTIQQVSTMENGKEWLGKTLAYLNALAEENRITGGQKVILAHVAAWHLHTEGVV